MPRLPFRVLRRVPLLSVAILPLLLAGCQGEAPAPGASQIAGDPVAAPGMMLSDVAVHLPAAPGAPAVAYFTLSQSGGAPRKLVGVHVDGFGRTELHQSVTTGGVASMRKVENVPLSAGQSVEFKPGGYHVMLFDADGSLHMGDQTELTITLDNGDKASVSASVEGPGAAGSMTGMGTM